MKTPTDNIYKRETIYRKFIWEKVTYTISERDKNYIYRHYITVIRHLWTLHLRARQVLSIGVIYLKEWHLKVSNISDRETSIISTDKRHLWTLYLKEKRIISTATIYLRERHLHTTIYLNITLYLWERQTGIIPTDAISESEKERERCYISDIDLWNMNALYLRERVIIPTDIIPKKETEGENKTGL